MLHLGSLPRALLTPPMVREHDSVVLNEDIPAAALEAGDIGTVIHIHRGGAGYEVEFMTLAGETVAVVTLLPNQIRSVARGDLAHVRELSLPPTGTAWPRANCT